MTNKRLTGYLLIVGTAGMLVATAMCLRPHALDVRHRPFALLSLVLILVIGELRPIAIARGEAEPDEVSITSTIGMALLLVAPLGVVIVAQSLALIADEARPKRRRSLVALRLLFNVGQYSLAFVTARLAYAAVTGDAVVDRLAQFHAGELPAALVAGLAFFLVNSGLTSVAFGLAEGKRLHTQLRTDARWQLASSAMLLGLAPVVAQAVVWSPFLLPLLLSPIVIVHRSADLASRREYEALHDGLTGLPNRTLLLTHLERCLDDTAPDHQTGLLLLDLDHFKQVNDTLGHAVGDQLIRDVAQRLRSVVRDRDLVARLGGDEFAVVAPGLTGTDAASELAVRLSNALREPFRAEGVMLDISWSVGIALSPIHADTVDLLLQRADVALYAAKETRGAHSVYDAEVDQHSLQRLTLAGDLRRTLEAGTLGVAYQPQVHARTRMPVGVEALVRWRHPALGAIDPETVIALAGSTGLLGLLTEQVLDRSLAVLRDWQVTDRQLTVSVNLTPRQLSDATLPDLVGSLLDRHGVSPRDLILEVTESSVMADATRTTAVVDALRDMGVGLSIDDFGTGYSSLAHLQRLRPEELKIDRSFVMEMMRGGNERTIVLSTLDLARNLGVRVVAEGVETEAIAAVLAQHGCDVLQGFAIARPEDEVTTTRWFEAQHAVDVADLPSLLSVRGSA